MSVLPQGFERARLLYRYSRDPVSNEALHEMCDGQGPILVLAQAQGRRFGAYSDLGLDSIGGWRKSQKSYLFAAEQGVPYLATIKREGKMYAAFFD